MKRRSLIKKAFTLGTSASAFYSLPLLAKPSDNPMLKMVHPELRDIANQLLNGNIQIPSISQNVLKQSRAGLLAMRKQPLAGTSVTNRRVPGMKGQPDVEIFIINADSDKKRPAIIHTHGGGFVMGSAQDSIQTLQAMSQNLDCVIVSVEYRLAPETTYIDSIEDNYAALKWVYKHAESLGVDPERIAVMGESAGGAHAALLAITARDRGEIPIAFQCLIYPMLDDRTGSSRSVPPHIGKILWTAESNRFGWSSFLGVDAGSNNVPAQAVPARITNLSGLPPTFIGVGSLDLFSDECIEYAQRLNASAVSTELLVIPGVFHGFDTLHVFGTQTRISQKFTDTKLNALRRGLGIKQPEACA